MDCERGQVRARGAMELRSAMELRGAIELGGALELRPAGPTLRYDDDVWGRPVSTRVVNLQVRAEAQCPR